MDYSPRIYRSHFRPFRNRPDITIPGRWYWCPPGAKALPFAHAMGSMCQDQTPRLGHEWDLGEIPIWEGIQTHVANSRYTGQHWCGTIADWQQGAVYGQTIELDREGVPLCCRAEPIRPGGGAVLIQPRQFSLMQALWWLQADVLTGAFLDPVTAWPNSDPSVNPGIGQGVNGGPALGSNAVIFQTFPPHGERNQINATHGFELSAATWYLVGGSINPEFFNYGVAIIGGSLLEVVSFQGGLGFLQVATRKNLLTVSIPGYPTYGIYSVQFTGDIIRLYFNGELIGTSGRHTCDQINIDGFIQTASPFGPSGVGATLLSEFLLFGEVLSPQDDYQVLNYLSLKYSIPLVPQPAQPDPYCLWWRPDSLPDRLYLCILWLRPEAHMCPIQGQLLTDWPDASPAADDAVNPSPTTAPTLDQLASLSWFAASFLEGQFLDLASRIQLSDTCTCYIVAATSSGSVPVGPWLGSIWGTHALGLVVTSTSVTYQDTAQTLTAGYVSAPDLLTIYEVRRGNGAVELRVNGQLIGTATDVVAGVLRLTTLAPAASVGSWSGSLWVPEVIVSRACYTDAEDMAVVMYLAAKYGIVISGHSSIIGSGGQANNGAALTAWTGSLTGSGGQANDGAATLLPSPTITGSGGQENDGGATLVFSHHYTGSGGSTNDGSATLVWHHHYTATGGGSNDGAATLTQHHALTGSGGSANDGAATLVPGGVGIALVDSCVLATGSITSATTGPMDSTTADLIVVQTAWLGPGGTGGTPVLTDSYGNSWTETAVYDDGTDVVQSILWFCSAPTVGPGHTYTVAAAGAGAGAPGICAMAFRGTNLGPTVQGSGSGSSSASSIQPGIISPVYDGSVLIAGLAIASGSIPTIDSGFSIPITSPFSGVVISGRRWPTTFSLSLPISTRPGRRAAGQPIW